MCVQIPFRLNPIASLAWLGKQLPCPLLEEGETKRKRRGFTSIQMLHTHTPGRNRENPERQEEEKSGHKRRAKAGTAQGGEGNKRTSRTNLHGETDLTNTEHTPEPHNTLPRGTGEELGTEWGTS